MKILKTFTGTSVAGINLKFLYISMLLALVVFSVLLPGCQQNTLTPPPAETITDPPIELDPLELFNEYEADPAGTMAKYEGKRLHFPYVLVEAMSFLGEPPDEDLYVQMGKVKFRVEYPSQLSYIREGYIVEATGALWGKQLAYLIIKNCWLKVIDPPGGIDEMPPEY